MNQYYLPRTIPADVKRQIRINSGFGCVICGLGIIHYEHVDPEYHNAKSHDPSKMTLLCPGCHNKVTTKIWSKKKVKNAMANPKALSKGFANEIFDIGDGHPKIYFAGSIIRNCPIPIALGGKPVFKILPSTEENGPFLLSANFYDSKGNNTLNIIDNEWFASSKNWDVTVVGQTITIREGLRNIALELTANPPDTLIVSKIEMFMQGLILKGNEKEFTIINPKTGKGPTFSGCIADDCAVGFYL